MARSNESGWIKKKKRGRTSTRVRREANWRISGVGWNNKEGRGRGRERKKERVEIGKGGRKTIA